MKKLRFLSFLVVSSCPLVFVGAAWAIDFRTEVQPILREKCFKCHSGPRAKGKLRYDEENYFSNRIGEGEDVVVRPGKPEMSRLIQLASLPRSDPDAMPPPNRGEGLSAAELNLIRQWIADGAGLESGGEPEKPASGPTEMEAPKLHSWTNTQGQTVEAYFVRKEDRNLVLKKEDGAEFVYPLTGLDAVSRELAAKLAAGQ